MSDTSQGPGWWRASNGKWYPPEATPGQRPPQGTRRPPGVPASQPQDPKIQAPFTLRQTESLEKDRERERRRQDRQRQSERRRPPWGWIGVGLLVIAFGGVGTWLALTADGDDDTAPVTTATTATTGGSSETTATDSEVTVSDEVSAFDLEVGDCFSAAPDDGDSGPLVTTAEVVSCDEDHLAEVILIGAIEGDGAFPGVAARDQAAEELCQPAFVDYVGVPLAASELGLLWLAPTEETWTDQDDRAVTCAVQSLDGDPLVGTMQGSGR
jgi:hypothetical protein